MYLLMRWIASAVAFYVTAFLGEALHLRIYIAPGVHAILPSLIGVAVFAVVNAVIRPVVRLLTLPLTCLTFGLFSLVVNALMFLLAGQFVPGFHVVGFVAPLFGSIMMSIFGALINFILVRPGEGRQDE